MSHETVTCPEGHVLRNCRCASPDKTVRIDADVYCVQCTALPVRAPTGELARLREWMLQNLPQSHQDLLEENVEGSTVDWAIKAMTASIVDG